MNEEELQAIRTVMCEEIAAALSASEQHTGTPLQALREEIGVSEQHRGEQFQTLRLDMREDLHVSEQRMAKHLDKIDARLDKLDTRLDKIDVRVGFLEARMGRIGGRLDQLEASQRDLREGMLQIQVESHGNLAQIRTDYQEMFLILNEANILINALQASQRNFENRFDDNLQALRRDLQKLQADYGSLENRLDHNLPALKQTMQSFITNTQKFAHDFMEANRLINTRLTYHENSPVGDTHPRPQLPSSAS